MTRRLATFASSRTFNMASSGSFGQHIPAIPFANFVRFANVLNCYLNDSVNHPDQVMAEQGSSPAALLADPAGT